MRRMMTLVVMFFSLTLAQPGFAQSNGASAKYTRSYEAEGRGDYAGALSALESLPKDKRSTYVYALRKGWLLYLSGKYDSSIASYKKAVAAAPKAVEPYLGIALPQMALRRWADAEKATRKALSLDADNYLAASRLAWSLYNQGRFADAAKYYQRMVALYPSDVEMKAGLGWALLKQGKKAEAAKLFEAVLDVHPAHASALEGVREAAK